MRMKLIFARILARIGFSDADRADVALKGIEGKHLMCKPA